MIDLHFHLPYSISDGPDTIEESITLLHQAAEGGCTYINAVSHFGRTGEIHHGQTVAKLLEIVETLKPEAAKLGITLHPGLEYDCFTSLEKELKPSALTIGDNSRFVLIDLCCGSVPFSIARQCEELRQQNLKPVIVHPDVLFDMTQFQGIKRIADNDAVLQLNAASFVDPAKRRFATTLLEAGLCHLIASDAHHPEGIRSWRMIEAREFIRNEYGEETAEILFETNPRRLLEDTYPISIKPSRVSRPWWKKLFNKQ